jgi:hypothetical protein
VQSIKKYGVLPAIVIFKYRIEMLHFKWKLARLVALQREFTKRIFSRADIPVDIPAILREIS